MTLLVYRSRHCFTALMFTCRSYLRKTTTAGSVSWTACEVGFLLSLSRCWMNAARVTRQPETIVSLKPSPTLSAACTSFHRVISRFVLVTYRRSFLGCAVRTNTLWWFDFTLRMVLQRGICCQSISRNDHFGFDWQQKSLTDLWWMYGEWCTVLNM